MGSLQLDLEFLIGEAVPDALVQPFGVAVKTKGMEVDPQMTLQTRVSHP